MKRALVTGGTGFLGRHLIAHLINVGVIPCLVSRPSPQLSQLCAKHPSVRVIPWSDDASLLAKGIAEADAQIAFHLAVNFKRVHTVADIPGIIHANINLGVILLEGMRASACRRLVYAGTVWQHCGQNGLPVTLYAATKHAFKGLVDYYCGAYGIEGVMLALADTYAKDDVRPRFLTALRKAVAARESLGATGGAQVVDLVHAQDVTAAFWTAARLEVAPDSSLAYNIPSGESCTLRELTNCIAMTLGRPVDVGWGLRPYATDEVFSPIFAYPTLPGWAPRISLRDGLREYFS